MMIRRTNESFTPRNFIDEVVYASLDWPGKTVRLERDTLGDYCQRPASPQISIAELYHENSKLFPQLVGELAATRVDVDEVRREFLQRRAQTAVESPRAEFKPPLERLLPSTAQTVPPELF